MTKQLYGWHFTNGNKLRDVARSMSGYISASLRVISRACDSNASHSD